MLALRFVAVLVISVSAHAQSLPIGEALYNSICTACHNANPATDPRAGAAANSPSALTNAISRVSQMRTAIGGLLTQQDIKDVAAYIGNPRGVPVNATTEAERIMNWAEWKYQTFLTPRATSQPIDIYSVRYYASPEFYVGVANGRVYTYAPQSPNAKIEDIGSTETFLTLLKQDGF
jgi:hypothetical protein